MKSLLLAFVFSKLMRLMKKLSLIILGNEVISVYVTFPVPKIQNVLAKRKIINLFCARFENLLS